MLAIFYLGFKNFELINGQYGTIEWPILQHCAKFVEICQTVDKMWPLMISQDIVCLPSWIPGARIVTTHEKYFMFIHCCAKFGWNQRTD